MAETCNSRRFSWLVKSCLPNPDSHRDIVKATPENHKHHHQLRSSTTTAAASISSLPDDLLLECLSRVPLSSLPSLSLVSRRFSLLLDSSAFLHLRRSHGHLRRTLYAVSLSDYGLLSFAVLPTGDPNAGWSTADSPLSVSPEMLDGSFTHPRLAAIGRSIYVLGRGATLRYDTWTETTTPRSPPLFPRKKFAAAAIAGKIYVAGGSARSSAVEEYDPESDTWRVVAEAPRRRYGCVGSAAGGVFFVIGGLKIGGRGEERMDAHMYAGSMDAYEVGTGTWVRARAVPGGGCVVGACGAGGHVYVVASHAVEVSFWRWEWRGRRGGEWARLESPPVPGQVRVDGAVRFCCVGVGESKVVVMLHVSSAADAARRGGVRAHGRDSMEGMVLIYDIGTGMWTRGPDLPAAFRRAACACVEC